MKKKKIKNIGQILKKKGLDKFFLNTEQSLIISNNKNETKLIKNPKIN